MSKLQVLVTTMHASDTAKYREMNLQTDAVIANQADFDGYEEVVENGCRVQLVSTRTRGLSRNRNIALAHANREAEYLMFSDDDLVFNDGYETLILEEFERHPEAEAIKFNLHDLSNTRKISMKRIMRFEKATRRSMSASGVCALVICQDIVRRHNLHFHEFFGTGTENFCGEDTIFLMEMLKKKIKLYRSPVDIAGIDQSESSWFRGFDERYFTTAGKVLRTAFPRLAPLLAVRSAFRFSRRETCSMGFLKILKYYLIGVKSL